MKHKTIALAFATATLLPAVAHAELGGARAVGFVTLATPSACGFSLEVTKSEGGLTDGTEALKLGASLKYTFGSAGFDPSGKLSVGAHVLYGSPSFSTASGAKVDVEIPDADCEAFNKSGGDISFSGSLGRNPDLFKLSIPADFGTQRGMQGDGTSVDLKNAAIALYGFTGTWTMGDGPVTTTPAGSEDDSGCTIAPAHHHARGFSALALGALGLTLVLRRRKR